MNKFPLKNLSVGIAAFLSLLLCSCSTNIEPVEAQYGIRNADAYNEVFRDRYEQLILGVAKSPDRAKPLEELAYFYHANLLLKEAMVLYEILLSRPEVEAKWIYYAVRVALDLGDQDLAQERLQASILKESAYGLAYFYLGEVLLKTGDLEGAELAYREFLEKGEEEAYALIGLGRVAIARKDWKKAESQLLSALRKDPKIVSAYSLLENVFRKLDRTDQLVRLKKAAGVGERYHQPKDVWMEQLNDYCVEPYRLSVIASIYEASGRMEEGFALLRKALELAPENSRLVFQLAEMLKKAGEPTEVTALLERALELDPVYESAHYAYVSELEVNHGRERALEASAIAVEQAGRASGLWRQRGVLLEKAGRISEAGEAFSKAVEMEPTEPKNQTALANFYWVQGEKAKAIEQYKEVRKLSPIEAKCRAILASHYLEEKNFEEASACIDEARAIDPNLDGLRELSVQYQLLFGTTKVIERDLVAAALSFEVGLSLDPAHLDSMVRLVAVYLEQDKQEQAQGVARAAIKAHPRSGIACRLMAGVEMKAGNVTAAETWFRRAELLSRSR